MAYVCKMGVDLFHMVTSDKIINKKNYFIPLFHGV